jgi:LmbE family N-acetylglucosaminyl deacetylase
MKTQSVRVAMLFVLLFSSGSLAQLPEAPPKPGPDDRYKADILLIVAHPDDDTDVAGYLARAIFDDHKRVAAIFCAVGDGGGNAVGDEEGAALGQVRIIEARRALESFGVANVWFLGGHDTPGQDFLWSLEDWNHGRALDEIVRLVRLTQPEVILTWLPDYVAGENHDDHQAAGVLATEAFDSAGDPTVFSEQVAMPRNRHGIMNMTEGLRPWQPKKIYYFSDAFEAYSQYWNDTRDVSPFRKNFLKGNGPEYSNAVVSPSRHVSYGRLAAEEQSFYLTQEGSMGKEALAKGDLSGFELPVQFIFGKSVVKSSVTGDIFEGIVPGPAPFARVPGFQPQIHEGLSLELGEPWAFYQEFWKAHNLEHLAQLLPVAEVAIDFGSTLHVPLVIRNATGDSEEVSLTVALPQGWTERTGSARYPVGARDLYPAQAILVAPPTGKLGWQEVTWKAAVGAREIGSVSLRVLLGKSDGIPQ